MEQLKMYFLVQSYKSFGLLIFFLSFFLSSSSSNVFFIFIFFFLQPLLDAKHYGNKEVCEILEKAGATLPVS
jgi:hypothetical protein